MTSRTSEKLARVAETYLEGPDTITPVQSDITSQAGIGELVGAIASQEPRGLHILVNSADVVNVTSVSGLAAPLPVQCQQGGGQPPQAPVGGRDGGGEPRPRPRERRGARREPGRSEERARGGEVRGEGPGCSAWTRRGYGVGRAGCCV